MRIFMCNDKQSIFFIFIGQFPYQVSFLHNGGHSCGGAIYDAVRRTLHAMFVEIRDDTCTTSVTYEMCVLFSGDNLNCCALLFRLGPRVFCKFILAIMPFVRICYV